MKQKVSFRYRILELLMRLSCMKLLCYCNLSFVEKFAVVLQNMQSDKPPKRFYQKYEIKKEHHNGAICYKISAQGGEKQQAIMFLHGGGWFMQINPFQWRVVEKIIDRTGYVVYIPLYLLAPKHTCEEALEFIRVCYFGMQKDGYLEPILLGDSAGAQITLSFIQQLKEIQVSQPKKAIVVSPPVSFTFDDDMQKKMREVEKKDVMLSVKLFPLAYQMWSGGISINDYRISPYFGDFHNLCPIYILVGTNEITYPLAIALRKKILNAGGTVSLYRGKGMMHTWTHLPLAPECKQGLNKIIKLL